MPNWSKLLPALAAVLLSMAAGAQSNSGLSVAITFDDLPVHGPLPPGVTRLQVAQTILDTLHEQQLPPTYGFINGVRTEEEPGSMAVLEAWRQASQPLGNHTWSHPSLESISAEQFIADVQANQPLLRSLMPNDDWHWFRYPYLIEGETLKKHRAVRKWLVQKHYKVAEVTIDFEDYLWNDPYARCMARKDAASIQVLHDTYLSTADQYIRVHRALAHTVYGHDIPYVLLLHIGAFDAYMLPDLLSLFRDRGFHFVSLPEAESDPAYAEDPDSADPGGGGLTEQLAAKRKLPILPNSKPYKRLKAICR